MTKDKIKQNFNKSIAVVSKLGTQRHLTALRDGFALSIPVTIAGAIAIFFITIVFGGWGAQKTSLLGLLAHASGGTKVSFSSLTNSQDSWELIGNWRYFQAYATTLFGWINAASLGMLSIYIAILIAYSFGVIHRHKSPVLVGVVGLATFLMFVKADAQMFSAKGMLVSIIASLVGAEIFMKLSSTSKLEIKLPPSVPPAVGRAFSILLPGFLTLLAAGLINVLVSLPFIWMNKLTLPSFTTLSYVITTFIQAPFISFAKSGADVSLLYVYVFGISFLWFFGVHGTNTLNGIFAPIMTLLWIDNLGGGTNVFTGGIFGGFGVMGGVGGTLALVILSLWLLPKGSPTKEVAKFALPVGIFQVNEPVLFGFPIIFSPKWFIPFIFAPMVGLIWPVIAIKAGLMNPETIPAPWTAPPLINVLISTQFDWRSIPVWLLSAASLIMVYLPFVLWQRMDDKKLIAQEGEKGGKDV